jgi:hypothetical protein
MVKPKQSAIFLLSILVIGCESKWVRLDNGQIETNALQQARSVCQVDQKLAQLEQAESRRQTDLAASRSNEATMLAKDNFALEAQAVNAGIATCMQQQGYVKD